VAQTMAKMTSGANLFEFLLTPFLGALSDKVGRLINSFFSFFALFSIYLLRVPPTRRGGVHAGGRGGGDGKGVRAPTTREVILKLILTSCWQTMPMGLLKTVDP
jgi:hypothetical protein